MLKKVSSYSEFIKYLFDDNVQVNFELIENEFHLPSNRDSELILSHYHIDKPSALNNIHLLKNGFVDHEGFRIYLIYCEGLVYSKVFSYLDVHVAAKFRDLNSPWKIVYDSLYFTWLSKSFHRHSKQTYTHPVKIEQQYSQYTLYFAPQEKFAVSRVVVDSNYRYIVDIEFSKNYSTVLRLSDLSLSYPEIANQLRFKVRSVDKFTTNNKHFREHLKILEMIAL